MSYSPPFLFPVRLASTGSQPRAARPLDQPTPGPADAFHANAPRLRVVAIDDHPAIREALRDTVDGQADMEVCGAVSSPSEAYQLIESVGADVAIVDINLGEESGLDVVAALRSRYPNLRIIVFSMFDETAVGQRAIDAGAVGYVTKTAPAGSVVDAIRAAVEGRLYRFGSSSPHRRGRLRAG